jgi:hypothetical protein
MHSPVDEALFLPVTTILATLRVHHVLRIATATIDLWRS